MKRGVIYARYSCDKQSDNSTKAQIRECEAWAKNNGITIIDHYLDEAISGKTDRRPGFQKMIADAKRRLFDFIVVWKGDRFSRSRADAAKYKTMLKKLGIRVLSATEANLEGPEAVLMDGINESFAEYYSVELAAKVTRGMHQNVLDGKFIGGKLPLGYTLTEEKNSRDRRIIIDEENAKVVRDIFSMYINKDMSCHAIRRNLLDRGIPMKSREGVRKILRNEKYIGIYRVGQTVNTTGFPAIISKEIFQKAQEKIASEQCRGARRKNHERYLLLGKVYCGHCNSALVSASGTSHMGTHYRYYRCPSNSEHPEHNISRIGKDDLERAVLAVVLDRLSQDEEIKTMVQTILKTGKMDNTNLDELQDELNKALASLQRIAKAIALVDDDGTLVAQYNEVAAKKNELEAKLNLERAKADLMSEDALYSFFSGLRDLDIESIDNRALLINTMVDSVFVFDDGHFDIFLNFHGVIGISLKKQRVLMSPTAVHHCPRLTNPYLVNQYVIGVRRSTKDGKVLPWID